ncbi:adenine-N1--methyltransferase [Sphaerosporella brunnea]|uniref:tRNA (adenine(58)-N(1))-methyltransferase catalytic subunit TRM61 n=1 Tax=Sphaerosporella brunnea TaxID=1250544 RepID=A0A5J5F1I2_9PEZI|nr:adenine-N1--methyltransferase [Sphaerosporella brunnea]
MATSEPTPPQGATDPERPPVSAFFSIPDALTPSLTPAIVHLKRDFNQAVPLSVDATLQTRFGTFPHSSFISLPPGSQVRASPSYPDPRDQRKRKRNSDDQPAATGFVHVLAPTAELWTSSLPHRTQVVYTPDSSYILHRLGVKPGSQVIEAGAGSGSFTHAAARAAYCGYPDGRDGLGWNGEKKGKVWSFEFHAERAKKLREEIANHGLNGIVRITHKDVCAEGFLVFEEEGETISPAANAVFLDLPAPWLAIPHLTRTEQSALDPEAEVRICTFSPCIEQVTRTCATLRQYGWVDVQTVELSHQRLEVRRQVPRGYDDGAGPRSIAEALTRLKGVNDFREQRKDLQVALSAGEEANFQGLGFKKGNGRKMWGNGEEGRLTSRQEPDLKSHTSFLTFAILPREWTEEQEKEAADKGEDKGVVGEKERRWKGQEVESNRARKKRERAEKKLAEEGEDKKGNGQAESSEDAVKMEIDG